MVGCARRSNRGMPLSREKPSNPLDRDAEMMGALIGTTIGDYTLGSLISTGGMAGVFEATHTTHRKRLKNI